MAKPISDVLPQVEVNFQKIDLKPLTYVTPYLSDRALMAAKNHRIAAKQPVFVKALLHDPNTKDYCKNCGGGGIIVLDLIEKGPFRNIPTTPRSITWFDGDGVNGKGWYIIERTLAFPCPECSQ